MQTSQEERNLLLKSQQFQAQVKRKLEQAIQSGKGKNWNHKRTGEFADNYRAAVEAMGGQVLQHGDQVRDIDVQNAIKKMGGNPYTRALKELQASRQTGTNLPANGGVSKSANSLVDQMFAEGKAQLDAANAANERRFGYGVGNLEALRARNQDRVKNFGIAAKEDLEARFSQNLGDVTAGLSSRGLGNSTITSAFEAKNARDLAREQQRLSEMVDDRASRYDTQDTGNVVNFVERRNDIAPDMNSLYELAYRYGQSGAAGGMGAAGGGMAPRPAVRGQSIPYAMSAAGAQGVANSYQGAYPSLQAMLNPVGLVGGIIGGVSNLVGAPRTLNAGNNRGVYQRTPEQQAAFENQQRLEKIAARRRQNDRQFDYDNSGGYRGFLQRQKYRDTIKNMPALPADSSGGFVGSEDMRSFFNISGMRHGNSSPTEVFNSRIEYQPLIDSNNRANKFLDRKLPAGYFPAMYEPIY